MDRQTEEILKNFHPRFFLLSSAADQARMMQDQMTGAASAMGQQDPKAAFKAEWEALEICQHQWALKNVEASLVQNALPTSQFAPNSAAQFEQQTSEMYLNR
jgi:hypothetical protein